MDSSIHDKTSRTSSVAVVNCWKVKVNDVLATACSVPRLISKKQLWYCPPFFFFSVLAVRDSVASMPHHAESRFIREENASDIPGSVPVRHDRGEAKKTMLPVAFERCRKSGSWLQLFYLLLAAETPLGKLSWGWLGFVHLYTSKESEQNPVDIISLVTDSDYQRSLRTLLGTRPSDRCDWIVGTVSLI